MTSYSQFNPYQNSNQVTNLDFSLDMLPNPSTNDLRTVSGLPAIVQSMQNIVFTNFSERPFTPSLSCNMQKMLFNQINPVTALQIQSEIAQTLTAWEPRVNITDVILGNAQDPNTLSIEVRFTLVNSPTVLSVQLFLLRKR